MQNLHELFLSCEAGAILKEPVILAISASDCHFFFNYHAVLIVDFILKIFLGLVSF